MTTTDEIFWDLLLLYQFFFFFSPQMKRSVVISNKHGIYELPHELLKDLTFRKNQENFKTSWNYKLVNSPPPKLKLLPIQRKLLKNRNWNFLVVKYFAWKLELVSNILSIVVGVLPHLVVQHVEEVYLACKSWMCWK